ncbi:putative Heterokaryon incompatibility protein-domain-containing protein [Seiridium unicorne]|uniref:Heterokaryon incompatibility protein-domain-containing protein n=1 Tax=Seiridium unicorne TaxID=138068 RepID=A0ABR2UXS3_9PEZI
MDFQVPALTAAAAAPFPYPLNITTILPTTITAAASTAASSSLAAAAATAATASIVAFTTGYNLAWDRAVALGRAEGALAAAGAAAEAAATAAATTATESSSTSSAGQTILIIMFWCLRRIALIECFSLQVCPVLAPTLLNATTKVGLLDCFVNVDDTWISRAAIIVTKLKNSYYLQDQLGICIVRPDRGDIADRMSTSVMSDEYNELKLDIGRMATETVILHMRPRDDRSSTTTK